MKCVLVDGLLAFMKGLRVLHIFDAETGAMLQGPLALTDIAAGEDLPTSHGWRLINKARANSKPNRRQRRRH